LKGTTHIVFGVTAFLLLDGVVHFAQAHPLTPGGHELPIGFGLCLAASVAGALVPDLDAEDSTIEHEMGLVGNVVNIVIKKVLGIKHRGVMHSAVAVAFATVAAMSLGYYLGGYWDVGLVFGIGYASHVFADGLTRSGVHLLWPADVNVHFLPPHMRVRTGSWIEGICALGVGVLMGMLLMSRFGLSNLGQLMQQAMHNLGHARFPG
jgi:inner membrane protein